MAGLVTGVAGLRLEADAVLDLWRGDDGQAGGDVAAARHEILGTADRVTDWYDGLATTMITGGELPQPLAHDQAADGRLVQAVRRDLLGDDGRASATAVRMIWTGDHLDVVRRLQAAVVSPAHATAGQPAGGLIIPSASQAIPGATPVIRARRGDRWSPCLRADDRCHERGPRGTDGAGSIRSANRSLFARNALDQVLPASAEAFGDLRTGLGKDGG